MRRAWTFVGALAVWAAGGAALGQPAQRDVITDRELSSGVKARLAAGYLSEDERKDLRVFHGVDSGSDRDTALRRGRAALLRGVIDDASLVDGRAGVLDVAEAMLLRGELEEALDRVEGEGSLRAARIRAEALEGLARFEEAGEVLEGVAQRLRAGGAESAAELTEGARALIVRARITGQEMEGGGDYQVIMGLLADARERLDRLYWPASLAEAELLWEKDNAADAQGAIGDVMSMNVSSAAGLELLGRVMVASFNFEGAESAAKELDALHASMGAEGSSPMGDLVRARARLRLNDPAAAMELIDGVLGRFPRMREAMALRAAAAAEAHDFVQADRWLDAIDEISPGSALGYLTVGETVSENREYLEAAGYLEEAAQRQPAWAAPMVELGLLEIQSGRDGRARDALEVAVELDPFNVRARNSLALLDKLASHVTVESEHFVVRYAPGVDAVLAPEMLPVLEAMHARVAGPHGFDHEPSQRTLIELMPDHATFAVRIAGMPRIHTIAAATGPVIAMESPKDGIGHSVGAYDWGRVLQHEYGHTVTLSRTRNRIPHWFTEAAAVWVEGKPRPYDWWVLLKEAMTGDSLFDFEEINIRFVRPRRPTDRTQAYAQGNWMYEFMVERWGNETPLSLMDLYAQGVGEAEAIERVLGMERSAFMDEFEQWGRGELVRAGMLPREGTPELGELLREAGRTGAGSAGTPSGAQITRWIESYPEHPEVLRLAAERAIEDDPGPVLEKETVGLLERYAGVRPVDPLPRQRLARHYLALGEGGAAIEHLEFLDAREQHSAAYAVELAQRYAAAGDMDRAGEKAERATRIAPFVAANRELAATVAIMRNDPETAQRHISALTVIEPDREIHTQRLEALRRRFGG